MHVPGPALAVLLVAGEVLFLVAVGAAWISETRRRQRHVDALARDPSVSALPDGSVRLLVRSATIAEHVRRGEGWAWRVSVDGMPEGAAVRISRRSGLGDAVERVLGEPPIEVGDPAFDRAFLLQGPPDRVLPVLTQASVRSAVSALFDQPDVDEVAIERGRLSLVVPAADVGAEGLAPVLAAVERLAAAVRAGGAGLPRGAPPEGAVDAWRRAPTGGWSWLLAVVAIPAFFATCLGGMFAQSALAKAYDVPDVVWVPSFAAPFVVTWALYRVVQRLQYGRAGAAKPGRAGEGA